MPFRNINGKSVFTSGQLDMLLTTLQNKDLQTEDGWVSMKKIHQQMGTPTKTVVLRQVRNLQSLTEVAGLSEETIQKKVETNRRITAVRINPTFDKKG